MSEHHGGRQPVVRTALRERHAEHDHAERVRAGLAPRRHRGGQAFPPVRALLRGRRVHGDIAVRDIGDRGEGDDRDDDAHRHAVRDHGDAAADGEESDAGADDCSEAEERVQQRHDRAPRRLLERRALDVHHDVDRAVAEAEEGEADEGHAEQLQGVGAEPDDGHADRDEQQGDEHAPTCPDPRHDGGRDGETDDGCHAHPQQQQPDSGVLDAERLADRRDARGPGRDAQSARQEDRADRDVPAHEARTGERGVHAATVSRIPARIESIREIGSTRGTIGR